MQCCGSGSLGFKPLTNGSGRAQKHTTFITDPDPQPRLAVRNLKAVINFRGRTEPKNKWEFLRIRSAIQTQHQRSKDKQSLSHRQCCGSGFLTPEYGIRSRDEQPVSYSISESLETIFWVKILLMESGIEIFRIRDKHPEPQHCLPRAGKSVLRPASSVSSPPSPSTPSSSSSLSSSFSSSWLSAARRDRRAVSSAASCWLAVLCCTACCCCCCCCCWGRGWRSLTCAFSSSRLMASTTMPRSEWGEKDLQVCRRRELCLEQLI